RGGRTVAVWAASLRPDGAAPGEEPARGGGLVGRAEGAGAEPDPGPDRPAGGSGRRADPAAGRGAGASGHAPEGRAVRRDRGAGAAGVSDRDGGGAVRAAEGASAVRAGRGRGADGGRVVPLPMGEGLNAQE